MLSWKGITTITTISALFGVLSLNRYNDSLVIFMAFIFLWNVIEMSSNDALSGFSNSGMITVGSLFIDVYILSRTDVINKFCEYVFGNSKSARLGMLRFLFLVNILSAFLNNTPLVALMMPVVRDWARKHNFPRSKFLIPLSYAAITGGMITVIGTSTTLLVQGILTQRKLAPLGFFELGLVALPLAFVSIIFLSTFGYWILPDNGSGMLGKALEHSEEYLTEVCVNKEFEGIGIPVFNVLKKIGIQPSSLVQLWRKNIGTEIEMNNILEDNKNLLSSYSDEKIIKMDVNQINESNLIREGDRMIISCKLDLLQNFRRFKIKGLSIGDIQGHEMKASLSEFCEVVISDRNPLLEKTMNCEEFKQMYSASIIGARRKGVELGELLNNTNIKAGDTLLILTNSSFADKYRNSHDFYVVCTIGKVLKPIKWHDYIPILFFLVMIILPATDIITTERSTMTLAALSFIFKWINVEKALEVIDWSLLIMIASSIGISRAMELSGLGLEIAFFLKNLDTSLWVINLLVYLVTLLMTEIITNNAAAAIVIPIALDVAKVYKASYKPFTVSVMMAASCGFAVPFGYATHLMVMSPGGYSFKDFIKLGIPMDILYLIGCSLLIPIIFPF